MRHISMTLVLGALLSFAPISFADELWRCPGNVFTNKPTIDQKKEGCTLVEGGITVVPVLPESERTPIRAPESTAPVDQKAAVDRRKVEAQLKIARQELSKLEAEYNNGEPLRMGPEFKNYQMYLDRIARLEGQVNSKRDEVRRLEGELK